MTKTIEPTVTTVLLGAAEVLRRHQWQKGQTFQAMPDGDFRVCAAGAIETYVNDLNLGEKEASNLIVATIAAVHDEIWKTVPAQPSLTTWNDRYASSKEEVIAMLEASVK